MCGIAGIFDLKNRTKPEDLQRMTECLAHRGPDGSGVWREGAIGLGHRRLSIIDPEAGHQPMASADGHLHISYNGELYNFKELREELRSKGHRFRTASDTEVVLMAWRQWGPECVLRFRGMFAFVIVDQERGVAFLARDHLGIKPLYYIHEPGFLAFASELQALRVLPSFKGDIDIKALDAYFLLDSIPAPKSIYREVRKLPPGHRIEISLGTLKGRAESYWTPTFRPEYGRSESEWLEEMDAVLRESVRAHLVADVPFGAFLSGGLDSTAVVGYMAEILEVPVKCFTIGFEEKSYDESPWAKIAAERWAVDQEVEILRPDALEILPQLARHYGEPFADSSAIPTYYLSRLARSHAPMVLSGDGGDELFAGYRTYEGWMRWISWEGRPRWRKLLYPLAQKLRPRRYLPRKPSSEAWLAFVGKMDPSSRSQLWRTEYLKSLEGIPEEFTQVFEDAAELDPINAVQLADLRGYLPNDTLTKVDIASMMNSLEVRTPFVDIRVAEFAARIPSEMNFGKGPGGNFEGKLLLKKLLSRYFPESFVYRQKQGFGMPVANWLGLGKKGETVVRERLLSPSSPLLEFLKPDGVAARIRQGTESQLWQLLFLDEWLGQRS